MGIEIGVLIALVAGVVGFVIAKAMGSKNEQKLADAQRRIDVLMVENEDLTTANQNLLAQKDIWNKTGDLVKKQAQTIKDYEAKLSAYDALHEDLNTKLEKAEAKLKPLKEKIGDFELYKSQMPPFWRKTIDERFDEAKCKGH